MLGYLCNKTNEATTIVQPCLGGRIFQCFHRPPLGISFRQQLLTFDFVGNDPLRSNYINIARDLIAIFSV